jgi:hypothetical protein
VAVYHDDDARPVAGPGERILIIHVVHTRKGGDVGGMDAEARLAAEVKALERERDELRAKGKKKNARQN